MISFFFSIARFSLTKKSETAVLKKKNTRNLQAHWRLTFVSKQTNEKSVVGFFGLFFHSVDDHSPLNQFSLTLSSVSHLIYNCIIYIHQCAPIDYLFRLSMLDNFITISKAIAIINKLNNVLFWFDLNKKNKIKFSIYLY